ncbi:MAG: putative manganese-dependent inorganic diphosphatase [Lentisphaeria bacterium]|nr:putative manganese-dependent inorganic diphosphatase [Lentisphaeria bacterium]
MEPIYIVGHRNPDTDSIVSAMAYAALKNALGERQYIAARLGGVSDETHLVLDKFGFQPPLHLHNIRTQVRDLNYDVPPAVSKAVTINHAWQIFQNEHVIALPVTNEDGSLHGMLSAGDIAAYDMQSIDEPRVEDIPVFNLLSALEGRILNESSDTPDTISGYVRIALPQSREGLLPMNGDTILLVGEQPEKMQEALDKGIRCLILCQAELPKAFRSVESKTLILSTPFDAYKAARLIYQSVEVERVCRRDDLVAFHLDDYVDDVRETVLQSRYRCYPVLDENDRVVGTLSRYHLLQPRRKRVVLVDHNELSQSVPGLDQAEILEIIDHHRLADVQTGNPIYFRNEPVGSTATIIATMYQEKGLMPSEKLAGLILAAIVSDTVMFKSPTCTRRDINMAHLLSRIAGISPEELGKEIFSVSFGEARSPKEMLFTDFKEFHIAGHDLGISQITTLDSAKLLEHKAEFLAEMEKRSSEKQYSMMLLMITDVLKEGTVLLCLGDVDSVSQAFAVEIKDHEAFLKGVVSRKKQIVPALSLLWG